MFLLIVCELNALIGLVFVSVLNNEIFTGVCISVPVIYDI